jgi:hypothetical protein
MNSTFQICRRGEEFPGKVARDFGWSKWGISRRFQIPIQGIDNNLQMKYSLASVSVGRRLWLSQREGFWW